MKRWISSLMLAGLATFVFAQAPFTIVRPADGSKVREKVRILIPKNSIPQGGYVGVFLNGKLVEATRPPLEGKYYVYTLDTKGRGLADSNGTPSKLELVLYTDQNDQARIVDRSSVDIFIANKANIPVPNKGISLRYRFVPGTEMVYNLEQRVILSAISEADQKRGGKAAQQDVDTEKIRLLYAVDNAYNDGDGLLRIQALPQKGKDYADLTTADDLQQKRYYTNQMASLYMRVTNTGREEFAALPPYVPMDGNASGVDPLNLYAVYPLPTLPSKNVRPGDSWESGFQEGNLDLSKYPNIDKVTTRLQARGEFIETEWEMGHPCAKLRNSIELADLKKVKQVADQAAGAGGKIADDKVSLTETIWFALDTKKVIKVQRDITIDRKGESAGGMGTPGGMGGPSGPSGAPPARGGGKAGAGGLGSLTGDLGLKLQGGPQGPQGPGGRPGGPPSGIGARPGGPPSGFGQGNGFGAGSGAGAGGGATFVRVRILQTFTLEK